MKSNGLIGFDFHGRKRRMTNDDIDNQLGLELGSTAVAIQHKNDNDNRAT
jgi:hypothetical protein